MNVNLNANEICRFMIFSHYIFCRLHIKKHSHFYFHDSSHI